ncbi:ABC transporter permease [Catenuloplanes atrovinosus]|uniref:Transport permease protein n=1 Tax=Catenuloplanes atrovinosus TaxID=137266 RepID=A0AAE3YUB1_9ACTN|nr:ABC transporter permease [Catenuloplanes atrovinosus]MDR7278544.1 lipooligosaccharide transport system permease protein [Catenuloplanes atrovinosus]
MTAAFEFHLAEFARNWRGSVFGSFVVPLLTVVGFGLGVGGYVQGGVDGVSYLHFLVPGLLAATALQIALSEATWPVMANMEWMKTYSAQAATPLRPADVFGGHLLFVLFRVTAGVGAFLLVGAVFGALRSPWAVACLPIGALLGLAVAAPVFAYTVSVPGEVWLSLLMRFAVLPMTLFAGVFFPVDTLPVALRWLAYATPLWHAADLSRAATLGRAPDWSLTGHLLYLALWAAAGTALAAHRFHRRLGV